MSRLWTASTSRRWPASVNGAGDLVAVTHTLEGAGGETPLALYRFDNGVLSLLSTPDIPNWTPGHLLMDAAFHPELNILALIDNTRPQLTLVEVVGEGEATRMKRWGSSIELERSPYSAKFTPDGRHVLSNAMYTGLGPETPRGTISSIRLNASALMPPPQLSREEQQNTSSYRAPRSG